MNGWRVGDSESVIYCRAETRGKARAFWPGDDAWEFWDRWRVDVWRAAWLDGPGPAREIDVVLVPCDCGEVDGCGQCYEGERLSKELTLESLCG